MEFILLRFRSIASVGIIFMIASMSFIIQNSKEKNEYDHVLGRISYFDREMGELPYRNKGNYRYLIIDTYPFPFEIYADGGASKIDSLTIDDEVTVFFYETDNTRSEKLNRFAQFIEKDGELYFERSGFQKKMGFVLVGLSVLLVIFGFVLWKAKKIPY